MNCVWRVSGITIKTETPFHLIPSGSLELKDSQSRLPARVIARSTSALRFALDEPFEDRGVVDGEVKIIVPILAGDLRYRRRIDSNLRAVEEHND